MRPRLDAIEEAIGAEHKGGGTDPTAAAAVWASRHSQRRPRRVIVVGDSLVTGVGCSSEHDGGPVLPRRIGERLADLLGVRVEWVALGVKGADMKTIRSEVIPALHARLVSHGVKGGTGTEGKVSEADAVDAVVLMCGVNDFKHALTGRTASAFRRELALVVDEIRSLTGDKCWVILPGLPMDLVTIFPPPLSYFAVYGNDVWDAQKRKIDDVARRVVFVSKPNLDAVRAEVGAEKPLTATDGIHPSEWGYAAWAHHIAIAIAPVLSRDK